MFYKQGSGGARSNKSFQSTHHQTITCLPNQHESEHKYSLSTCLTFTEPSPRTARQNTHLFYLTYL